MASGTNTTSNTSSLSEVTNIKSLMGKMGAEICHLNVMVGDNTDFDVDLALVEISILTLNDVISAVRLQFYLGEDLVREHAYVLTAEGRQPQEWGPPPEQVERVKLPSGTRVRLVVRPNPNQPEDFVSGWFQRMGWTTAKRLVRPDGDDILIGTYVSGRFGAERRLLVNPKFDQPISQSLHKQEYKK